MELVKDSGPVGGDRPPTSSGKQNGLSRDSSTGDKSGKDRGRDTSGDADREHSRNTAGDPRCGSQPGDALRCGPPKDDAAKDEANRCLQNGPNEVDKKAGEAVKKAAEFARTAEGLAKVFGKEAISEKLEVAATGLERVAPFASDTVHVIRCSAEAWGRSPLSREHRSKW